MMLFEALFACSMLASTGGGMMGQPPGEPKAASQPVEKTEAESSPAVEAARLWENAEQELRKAPSGQVEGLSELARMLHAVRNDQKLGPGVGWYSPSQRRYDWAWLANRFDADKNDRVAKSELGEKAKFFAQLDRDNDGAITASDLDWSPKSAWVQQDSRSLMLLRGMDSDGNGRVDEKEWISYFRKVTAGKDHLSAKDLQTIVVGSEVESGRAKKQGAGQAKGKKVSREVWLRCLIEGDLGSSFPGPAVDAVAPDFTLPVPDGKGEISLSSFRGKKPVVLIFGSFT